jgi:anti-anti-sigma regulatory factor
VVVSLRAPAVVADDAGLVVMTLSGQLTAANAPAFLEALRRVLASSPTRVLIDMGSVTGLDGPWCRALVAGLRDVHSAGIGVGVRGNIAPSVRRIVDVAFLAALLDGG